MSDLDNQKVPTTAEANASDRNGSYNRGVSKAKIESDKVQEEAENQEDVLRNLNDQLKTEVSARQHVKERREMLLNDATDQAIGQLVQGYQPPATSQANGNGDTSMTGNGEGDNGTGGSQRSQGTNDPAGDDKGGKPLSEMGMKELQDYAKAHDIDVSTAQSKVQARELIEKAEAERAAGNQ